MNNTFRVDIEIDNNGIVKGKVYDLSLYEKGKLSFSKLKEFGINAIRSQRYMPLDLSKYINNTSEIY